MRSKTRALSSKRFSVFRIGQTSRTSRGSSSPRKRRPWPKGPSGARARPCRTSPHADRVLGPRGTKNVEAPRSGSHSSSRSSKGSRVRSRPQEIPRVPHLVVPGTRRSGPCARVGGGKLEEVDEEHIERVVHPKEAVVKMRSQRGPPCASPRRASPQAWQPPCPRRGRAT